LNRKFNVFTNSRFYAGPIIIIFSGFLVVDYVRQAVSYVVSGAIITIGHIFFLILVRPWPKNKMFPYHVKTNAIGTISDKPDNEGVEETENYPHHEPGKGGNENFEDLTLKEIITSSNRQKKYEVNEATLESVRYTTYYLYYLLIALKKYSTVFSGMEIEMKRHMTD
jgi:hypothetical protein